MCITAGEAEGVTRGAGATSTHKSRRDGTLLTVCFSLRAILLLAAAFFFCVNLSAQVTIGGTNEPAKGAILDLNSTAKGGLLLSNVSITDLSKIPAGSNLFPGITAGVNDDTNTGFTGAIVYNTNPQWGVGTYVWNGTYWAPFGENCLEISSASLTITYPSPIVENRTVTFSVSGVNSGWCAKEETYKWYRSATPGMTPDYGTLPSAFSTTTIASSSFSPISPSGSYYWIKVEINNPFTSGTVTKEIPVEVVPLAPTGQWVKAAANNAAAIASLSGTDGGSFTNGAPNYTVDIDDNMIPVVNKLNDGYFPESWGNYDEKQWCNAVTVKSEKLAKYKTSPAGTEIAENDILGYWVYVPRYKYQVFRYDANNDNSNYRTQTSFNIIFQKPTDPKAIPASYTGSGDYQSNVGANNAWATHPAFTIGGTTELAGFWYAKFEASRSDGWFCATYINGDVCNTGTTASYIGTPLNTPSLYTTFKPNEASASYQRVSNQYLSAKYVKTAHNISTFDTHMSNNSHWGATVYLATSIYGTDYPKVYNNGYLNMAANTNSASAKRYITGCGPITSQSDDNGPTCNTYETAIGQQASTTGNIYGIYDMAGGSWEYQLAVLTCGDDNHLSTGRSTSENSGFSNGADNCYYGSVNSTQPVNPTFWPDSKYLNIYPRYSIFTNVDNSNGHIFGSNQCTWATCGGQALHETRSVQSISTSNSIAAWGSDLSMFVVSGGPWLYRGGASHDSSGTGLFASYDHSGASLVGMSFRVVLGAY
jgi:hypothetical protein